jgi:hypothetical protein
MIETRGVPAAAARNVVSGYRAWNIVIAFVAGVGGPWVSTQFVVPSDGAVGSEPQRNVRRDVRPRSIGRTFSPRQAKPGDPTVLELRRRQPGSFAPIE